MQGIVVAVIAGLVQGVVEWLPVSSKTIILFIYQASGSSFAVAYVMGLLANGGSFLAALVFFRRDLVAAIRGLRHPLGRNGDGATLRYLVLATAATGIVALPIYVLVRHAFGIATGADAMIVVGMLLLATSAINRRREHLAGVGRLGAAGAAARGVVVDGSAIPGTTTALLVGAAQGLAALPGISRSAVTVTPLLWRGHTPAEAVRYSFFLDVIGLLGAGLVPFVLGNGGTAALRQVGLVPVIAMLLVAGVASFVMIGASLRFAQRLRASVVTLVIGLITVASGLLYAGLG